MTSIDLGNMSGQQSNTNGSSSYMDESYSALCGRGTVYNKQIHNEAIRAARAKKALVEAEAKADSDWKKARELSTKLWERNSRIEEAFFNAKEALRKDYTDAFTSRDAYDVFFTRCGYENNPDWPIEEWDKKYAYLYPPPPPKEDDATAPSAKEEADGKKNGKKIAKDSSSAIISTPKDEIHQPVDEEILPEPPSTLDDVEDGKDGDDKKDGDDGKKQKKSSYIPSFLNFDFGF